MHKPHFIFLLALGHVLIASPVAAQTSGTGPQENAQASIFKTSYITEAFQAVVGNSASERLQKALESPNLAIEGYSLNMQELNRFYALRQYRPAWDTKSSGDRAGLKSFLTSMVSFTNYHGLDANGYPFVQLGKLIESNDESDALKIELLTTDWLLRLGGHLQGASLKLSHIYPGWSFKRDREDVATGLENAVRDNRIHEYISGLAPDNAAYIRLARGLKTYRDIKDKGGWPTIDKGPTIKPGSDDPRVTLARARLAAEGYVIPQDDADAPQTRYDEDLKAAVEAYQAHNGLEVDGNIGPKTVASMNVSVNARIDQILANMERWRHMPESFPSRYAVVNVASARLEVRHEESVLYTGPVVVGRTDRKTPFIQSAIRSIVFNPAWNVPAKIARKDILPKLRKDPHYLEKMGFVIKGSADDPHGYDIDWDSLSENNFNFRLRQSPSDINSLGKLKFDFDNDFAVYMHGTPHLELFGKAERHLSSGCVRLHDPDRFAEIVLAGNETAWSLDRVKEEISKGKTRWLKVGEPLPVFFVYWTVFSDNDDGPLHFRKDIYAYDSFLMETARKNVMKESPSAAKDRSMLLI